MSDEELRHLERRALTNDPSALLQYAIALHRSGQLAPSFPAYPFYTPPVPFLPITIGGLVHDNEGHLTLVPHPGTLYIRPTNEDSLVLFSPDDRVHFPEIPWIYGLDEALISAGFDPGTELRWRCLYNPRIELELEKRVTAWVSAHPQEMHQAKILKYQSKVGLILQGYLRVTKEAEDLRKKVEEQVEEWLQIRNEVNT